MKLLNEFKAACHAWHFHIGPCYPAHQWVYVALIRRHGQDAVLRHVRQIKEALDRAETGAALTHLAPSGFQASAIALAVQLLDVAVNSEPARADELGEVLGVACGWETERSEEGLELVRCAVQRAVRLHDEATGEIEC